MQSNQVRSENRVAQAGTPPSIRLPTESELSESASMSVSTSTDASVSIRANGKPKQLPAMKSSASSHVSRRNKVMCDVRSTSNELRHSSSSTAAHGISQLSTCYTPSLSANISAPAIKLESPLEERSLTQYTTPGSAASPMENVGTWSEDDVPTFALQRKGNTPLKKVNSRVTHNYEGPVGSQTTSSIAETSMNVTVVNATSEFAMACGTQQGSLPRSQDNDSYSRQHSTSTLSTTATAGHTAISDSMPYQPSTPSYPSMSPIVRVIHPTKLQGSTTVSAKPTVGARKCSAPAVRGICNTGLAKLGTHSPPPPSDRVQASESNSPSISADNLKSTSKTMPAVSEPQHREHDASKSHEQPAGMGSSKTSKMSLKTNPRDLVDVVGARSAAGPSNSLASFLTIGSPSASIVMWDFSEGSGDGSHPPAENARRSLTGPSTDRSAAREDGPGSSTSIEVRGNWSRSQSVPPAHGESRPAARPAAAPESKSAEPAFPITDVKKQTVSHSSPPPRTMTILQVLATSGSDDIGELRKDAHLRHLCETSSLRSASNAAGDNSMKSSSLYDSSKLGSVRSSQPQLPNIGSGKTPRPTVVQLSARHQQQGKGSVLYTVRPSTSAPAHRGSGEMSGSGVYSSVVVPSAASASASCSVNKSNSTSIVNNDSSSMHKSTTTSKSDKRPEKVSLIGIPTSVCGTSCNDFVQATLNVSRYSTEGESRKTEEDEEAETSQMGEISPTIRLKPEVSKVKSPPLRSNGIPAESVMDVIPKPPTSTARNCLPTARQNTGRWGGGMDLLSAVKSPYMTAKVESDALARSVPITAAQRKVRRERKASVVDAQNESLTDETFTQHDDALEAAVRTLNSSSSKGVVTDEDQPVNSPRTACTITSPREPLARSGKAGKSSQNLASQFSGSDITAWSRDQHHSSSREHQDDEFGFLEETSIGRQNRMHVNSNVLGPQRSQDSVPDSLTQQRGILQHKSPTSRKPLASIPRFPRTQSKLSQSADEETERTRQMSGNKKQSTSSRRRAPSRATKRRQLSIGVCDVSSVGRSSSSYASFASVAVISSPRIRQRVPISLSSCASLLAFNGKTLSCSLRTSHVESPRNALSSINSFTQCSTQLTRKLSHGLASQKLSELASKYTEADIVLRKGYMSAYVMRDDTTSELFSVMEICNPVFVDCVELKDVSMEDIGSSRSLSSLKSETTTTRYTGSRRKRVIHPKCVEELKKVQHMGHRYLQNVYDVQTVPGKIQVLIDFYVKGSFDGARIDEGTAVSVMMNIISVLRYALAFGISHGVVSPICICQMQQDSQSKENSVESEMDRTANKSGSAFGEAALCALGLFHFYMSISPYEFWCLGSKNFSLFVPERILLPSPSRSTKSGAALSGEAIDLWGLGATMYKLLFGHDPFALPPSGERLTESQFRAWMKTSFSKAPSYQASPGTPHTPVSAGMLNLLKQLLSIDPAARGTFMSVMRHSRMRVERKSRQRLIARTHSASMYCVSRDIPSGEFSAENEEQVAREYITSQRNSLMRTNSSKPRKLCKPTARPTASFKTASSDFDMSVPSVPSSKPSATGSRKTPKRQKNRAVTRLPTVSRGDEERLATPPIDVYTLGNTTPGTRSHSNSLGFGSWVEPGSESHSAIPTVNNSITEVLKGGHVPMTLQSYCESVESCGNETGSCATSPCTSAMDVHGAASGDGRSRIRCLADSHVKNLPCVPEHSIQKSRKDYTSSSSGEYEESETGNWSVPTIPHRSYPGKQLHPMGNIARISPPPVAAGHDLEPLRQSPIVQKLSNNAPSIHGTTLQLDQCCDALLSSSSDTDSLVSSHSTTLSRTPVTAGLPNQLHKTSRMASKISKPPVKAKQRKMLMRESETELVNVENVIEECRESNSLDLQISNLQVEQFPQTILCPPLIILTVLDISNNKLKSIPPDIKLLVNLRRLMVGSNQLSSLPDEIGCLTDLEVLDANRNSISLLPPSIVLCANLYTLALDYNDFKEIPSVIADLNVQQVYLAANPCMRMWPPTEVVENFPEQLTLGIDNEPLLVRQYAHLKDVIPNVNIMWNKIYPDEIIPGLFCGSLRSAQTQRVYERFGIQYVLTVARDIIASPPENGVHKTINVDDLEGATIDVAFKEAVAFIDEAMKKRVGCLVHCFAGMSRSATVVIAYLMMRCNMRLDEAYTTTRRGRPAIYPNSGFFEQLLKLDEKLYPNGKPLDMACMERHIIPNF